MHCAMNNVRHAAFNHASNCLTLSTDLVHLVEMLKIAYVTSGISRRMRWMRKGEPVGLNIAKMSEQIYMRLIAGQGTGA